MSDEQRLVHAKRGKTPIKLRRTRRIVWIDQLTIVNDHRTLKKNHDVDWRYDGTGFVIEHALSDSRPVSFSKNNRIGLKIVLRSSSNTFASGRVTLRGKSNDAYVSFSAEVEFTNGRADFFVNADMPLPDRIKRLTPYPTSWHCTVNGIDHYLGVKNWDEVFVLFNKPINDLGSPVIEDGVTIRRTRTAVALVEKTGGDDPHEIVARLMRKLGKYVVQPIVDKNPTHYAPAVKLGGPRFFEEKYGGAWAIAENPDLYGECQALVRFVIGVLRQLGVPGKAATVLVYADEEDNSTAKTEHFEYGKAGGLGKSKYIREISLPDGTSYVQQLMLLPQMDFPILEITKDVVPNAYEACLLFSYDGETRYYPGGVDGKHFRSSQEVLEAAFKSLVWVAGFDEGFMVFEVVAHYP